MARTLATYKMKLRRGDTVEVLSGRDRGKRGTVSQVLPKFGMVVVEGVNVRTKHVPSRKAKQPGQRMTFNAPLPAGKVALVDPNTDKRTRVGYQLTAAEGGKVARARIARKSNKPA